MQANVYFLTENLKETFDSILLTRFTNSFVSKSGLQLKPTRMLPICIRHLTEDAQYRIEQNRKN